MGEKENLSIEAQIVDTVQQTKNQTFEIVTTATFTAIALFLYLLGYSTFLPFIVLFFGALWNFFTPINRFMAIAFGFVVCTLYAWFAIDKGLYGQAFLHLLFYLPTQLIFYYTNRQKPAIEIQKDKSLKPTDYAFIALTGILLLIFSGMILSKIEGAVLPYLDSISVVFLIISVFLVNNSYKEYYMWRIFATTTGAILWATYGIFYGFDDGIITMILLFAMYAAVDGFRGARWLIKSLPEKNKKTVDEGKLKKVQELDEKIKQEETQLKASIKPAQNKKRTIPRKPTSKTL